MLVAHGGELTLEVITPEETVKPEADVIRRPSMRRPLAYITSPRQISRQQIAASHQAKLFAEATATRVQQQTQ